MNLETKKFLFPAPMNRGGQKTAPLWAGTGIFCLRFLQRQRRTGKLIHRLK
jgi:hypothetical protein